MMYLYCSLLGLQILFFFKLLIISSLFYFQDDVQTQAQQFAHVASVPHYSQDLQPHLGNYQVATATLRVVHSAGPRGSPSTKAKDGKRDTSPTASSLRRRAPR